MTVRAAYERLRAAIAGKHSTADVHERMRALERAIAEMEAADAKD